MPKITYADIKNQFSKEDLSRYDILCKKLVAITLGKTNVQLWEMAQTGQEMRNVLDELHAIRARYDFLQDEKIFKVWSFNIKTKQREELEW
jgi:hypothetical protein